MENGIDGQEKKVPELTSHTCEKCGKPLVIRKSKKGEFYACSGFPKCRFIKAIDKIN